MTLSIARRPLHRCALRNLRLGLLVGLAGLMAGCAAGPGLHRRGPGVLVASRGAASAPARVHRNQADRQIIKTANVRLITKTPREAAQKTSDLARELGGFITRSANGDKRSELTMRVPNANFSLALARLRKLGDVDEIKVRGRDVTAQVIDLDIRLKTALKVRERYLQLLAKAVSVKEALPVQQQLERVNTEIERLKGQLAFMRDQVALSTINVTLKYPVRPGIVGWVFYGLYKGVKWLFVWD